MGGSMVLARLGSRVAAQLRGERREGGGGNGRTNWWLHFLRSVETWSTEQEYGGVVRGQRRG